MYSVTVSTAAAADVSAVCFQATPNTLYYKLLKQKKLLFGNLRASMCNSAALIIPQATNTNKISNA